jgi:hypothetical protein
MTQALRVRNRSVKASVRTVAGNKATTVATDYTYDADDGTAPGLVDS